ncbi:DUF2157 domain-containing protein [Rapidithrix thailandica]|uniref:DUF2157 domain-containing protein n=1 Tax=Rapidithrix thailandica TaxID=413964 RepID=A0AAW9RYI5_9BACT
MNLSKQLPELVHGGIISQETADRIQEYYQQKKETSTNRLFIIFAVLGALLVGLGVILIIAHNWDELSRNTKTALAFIPLLLGQALCGYTLLRQQQSFSWREGSSTFLFLTVGASIALISQIYHLPGNLSAFLLTWALLGIPLVYIMKSSVVSLLYLIAITYYAGETSYWSYPQVESYLYWLLLFLALPHYYSLFKKKPGSNFMIFHNWFIPLSITITLGTVAYQMGEWMFIAYTSLFGLFYLIGNSEFFRRQKLRNNGFRIIGSLGTIALFLGLSFDWFWKDLSAHKFHYKELIVSPEFLSSAILTVMASVLLYFQWKNKPLRERQPLEFAFVLFLPIFILGLNFHIFLLPSIIFIIISWSLEWAEMNIHLVIISLMALFYLAGLFCHFKIQKSKKSTFYRAGLFGTVGILLGSGFYGLWQSFVLQNDFIYPEIFIPEYVYFIVSISLALSLLFLYWKNKPLREIPLLEPAFVLLTCFSGIGILISSPMLLINLLILIIGLSTIWRGIKSSHMGIMNYGLFIITALVTCKFFDSNLSFVLRGVVFVLLGIGFFVSNYHMLKKRKTDEQ